ncbi:Mitogen-activated protein kinase kinase kinase 2 [Aphelenchoides avenae]|nr:Mitogen-activated protein kinase kinase kinase 2 [Aphelenchus avenae]
MDVYPVGIIASECLAMRMFPENYDVVEWVRIMRENSKKSPPSDVFKDFVRKCVQEDAGARATVADLLEHSFVQLADRSSLKELIADII